MGWRFRDSCLRCRLAPRIATFPTVSSSNRTIHMDLRLETRYQLSYARKSIQPQRRQLAGYSESKTDRYFSQIPELCPIHRFNIKRTFNSPEKQFRTAGI